MQQGRAARPPRRNNRPPPAPKDPRWYFPGYGYVARARKGQAKSASPHRHATVWEGVAGAGHVSCLFCDLSFTVKDRSDHEHTRHQQPTENYIARYEVCHGCHQAWWTTRKGGQRSLDSQEMDRLYLCPARYTFSGWIQSGLGWPRWIRTPEPVSAPFEPYFNFNEPLPFPSQDPFQVYARPSDAALNPFHTDTSLDPDFRHLSFTPQDFPQPANNAFSPTLNVPYYSPPQPEHILASSSNPDMALQIPHFNSESFALPHHFSADLHHPVFLPDHYIGNAQDQQQEPFVQHPSLHHRYSL